MLLKSEIAVLDLLIDSMNPLSNSTLMTTSTKRRLFGTDGVRGEAGRFPLDAATMETIGASLAASSATHL